MNLGLVGRCTSSEITCSIYAQAFGGRVQTDDGPLTPLHTMTPYEIHEKVAKIVEGIFPLSGQLRKAPCNIFIGRYLEKPTESQVPVGLYARNPDGLWTKIA